MRSRQIGCSGKALSIYASTRQALIVVGAGYLCVFVCVLTEPSGYNRSQPQESKTGREGNRENERKGYRTQQEQQH